MADLIKWKIYCIDEQENKTSWSATMPTECPTDPLHEIGDVVDDGFTSRHVYGDMKSSANTFTPVQQFIFTGSSYELVPSLIRCVAYVVDGTARVRVYDLSNSQTIVTSDTISNTTPQVIVFPALANVPVQGAMWEIQIIKDTESGDAIVESLTISSD